MDHDLTKPLIALLQMNCTLADTNANLKRAEELLSRLDREVAITCLPELFNSGYSLDALGERIFDLAEPVPEGQTTQRLMALAQNHGTGIIAGVIEQAPRLAGLIYDTAVLINRHGELVGRYRKSHLYPAEHRYFRA